MNVFEDLVVELKEENLLEETFIENDVAIANHLHVTDEPNKNNDVDDDPVILEESSDIEIEAIDFAEVAAVASEESAAKEPTKRGSEFFKKRAMAEVSSLQMVEHVLTGVELQYLRTTPVRFDDFKVKKTLNGFLHLTSDANHQEHADAEFALMQETEAWCSALAARDREVPVSALRMYCENTKPALSSQALLSLARFYRNLPFSEPVRAKFDFVITRLFSRPIENAKRACLFDREENFAHVSTLYREWSSVPLYSADEDESKVLLTALSFEDLAVEAENCASFEQLIDSDFFGRLRIFKESISELFYAPNVTAAAIEANVRIGNAYVALVARERDKAEDAETIQLKYGGLDNEGVSDATARTLEFIELLNREPDPVEEVFDEEDEIDDSEKIQLDISTPAVVDKKAARKAARSGSFIGRMFQNAFAVNKVFLAIAVLLIGATIGLYVWANFVVEERVSQSGVRNANVEAAGMREHVKVSKISGDTLYVQLLPSWNALPKEKRTELLQKVLEAGPAQGYQRVSLLNKEGKQAGFASSTRIEVVMP